MKRRGVLAATGLGIAALAGCVSVPDPALEADESATPTDGGSDEPGVGSPIVSVTAAADLDSPVVIDPACRAERITVEPGETAGLKRVEAGESCRVKLIHGEAEIYDERVDGAATLSITVLPEGEVTVDITLV